MRRIALLILTNLAVMLTIFSIISFLGIDRFLTSDGLNLSKLLAFSIFIGFFGAFISLLFSKPLAKWSVGVRIIDPSHVGNKKEIWLLNVLQNLSKRAGIVTPELGIFDGEPNAFATGAFKNSALIAVSTGLLNQMNEEEVTAVIGHEIAHVANGDMVTLTLIQGVLNTFVVFFSRIVGYLIDKVILKNEKDNGTGYQISVFVLEIIFGILASIIVAWFSRKREYRADFGSSDLMGSAVPMIHALKALDSLRPETSLPESFKSSGLIGGNALSSLFASHPTISDRIAALERQIILV